MTDLPDYPTFGQRLRYARMTKGLTLKELDAATGIDLNILSRYERDLQRPSSPERYTILADALDVPSGWFVEATMEPAPPPGMKEDAK